MATSPTRRLLRIAGDAYIKTLTDLSSRPAEAGGILLGPIGASDITAFHFDTSARCSGGSYTPDHVTLNTLLREVWIPAGIDFKGVAHSHPRGYDRLSPGDLANIRRQLARNEDLDFFAAPIVLPSEYRLCPFIVTRDRPDRPVLADLVLF